MSIRNRMVALATTLLLLVGAKSEAAFIGSQGFNDQGQPLAGSTATNGTANGNINTATWLTVGDLNTTLASTGVFAGIGKNIDLGMVTFSTANGANTTFTFSDPTGKFGSFTSSTVTSVLSGTGVRSFLIVGLFTPGNYAGYGGVTSPQAASVTISFTQTPAGNGSISDSASLAVPPSGTVPEPASFAMVVIGFGGVFAARRFRRRSA